MRFIALLLFVSCALPPASALNICETPCGAKVRGVFDDLACDNLARYEALAVDVMEPLLPGYCQSLKAWTIQIMETSDGWWVDEWGREVGGLTYCDEKLVKIGTDIWEESAFAHEAIHVWSCPDGDPGHINWASKGYYAAFQTINERYLGK